MNRTIPGDNHEEVLYTGNPGPPYAPFWSAIWQDGVAGVPGLGALTISFGALTLWNLAAQQIVAGLVTATLAAISGAGIIRVLQANLHDQRSRRYIVTEKWVLNTGSGGSLFARRLPDLVGGARLVRHTDGTGTVLYGPAANWRACRWDDILLGRPASQLYSFERIEHPEAALAKLQAATSD